MILDIIAGILIAIGLYQGYSQGLIKTVFAALSIVIAIVASLKLSPILIRLLQDNIDFNPAILFILGFVITFVAVMALIRFLGKKLESVFKDLNITIFNKLLGAGLMGLLYAIILSYAVHFTDKIGLVSDDQKSSSVSYTILQPLPAMTAKTGQKIKPIFQEFWQSFLNTMDSIKEEGEKIGTQEQDDAG